MKLLTELEMKKMLVQLQLENAELRRALENVEKITQYDDATDHQKIEKISRWVKYILFPKNEPLIETRGSYTPSPNMVPFPKPNKS